MACAALQGGVSGGCSLGLFFFTSLTESSKVRSSPCKDARALCCCLEFILCGFNPKICGFISPIGRFIVPLWSMQLALLTPASVLFLSFYQTLFAPSLPSFLSDLALLSPSLSLTHTHTFFLFSLHLSLPLSASYSLPPSRSHSLALSLTLSRLVLALESSDQ